MAPMLQRTASTAPLQRVDGLRLTPAKGLIEVEIARQRVGLALSRAIGIIGLTDKEAADLIGIDKSQLSRWLSGGENVQVHRIYGTKLHGPFAIEQCRDDQGCVIETTVTWRAR
jgi:hypothetical protein